MFHIAYNIITSLFIPNIYIAKCVCSKAEMPSISALLTNDYLYQLILSKFYCYTYNFRDTNKSYIAKICFYNSH